MDGAKPEGTVLIYDDDHYYMGSVIAEKLVADGCTVVFVTPDSVAASWTVHTMEQHRIQARLMELGVEIIASNLLKQIDEDSVTLACAFSGQIRAVAAASVVMVVSRLPDDALYQALVADPERLREAGIAINGLADYAFIFGHFGFPAMGLVGAGIASAIVKTLMFLATLGFVLTDRRLARYRLFGYFWRPDWPRLREIVTVGVPIAMTEMAEGGVVLVASVLMGLISVDALAAHGVTVQCIIIVIIVPVGLMQAASVRVGRAAGASDYPAATRAGRIAIGLGLVYSFVIAAAFLLFGDVIVGVFLDDSVAENRLAASLAVSFLAIGGIFFIADSTQIITRGALMGLKDTPTPMVFALGSYGLTLPAAGFFAVYLGYGGEAIWLCMLVSAVVLAVMLVRRFETKCMRLIELAEAA